MTRLYYAGALQENATYTLNEKASHYLANVLRIQLGESIVLFNGEGGEFNAKVVGIKKKQVTVQVINFIPAEIKAAVKITLAQGIAKGEKMDFIVQKATELGVDTIVPLITERSNVHLSQDRWQHRLQHWQGVAISACEQCGRTTLPQINSPQPFTKWLPTISADLCVILSPYAIKNLPDASAKIKSIVLLIGPEGGFSETEVKLAEENSFQSIQLGPRILRTETATLVGLSILQFQFGDLKTIDT